MKPIVKLFFIILMLGSPAVFSQGSVDPTLEKLFALQTAMDALEHGPDFYNSKDGRGAGEYGTPAEHWDRYPRFGVDKWEHPQQQVFRASEYISNYVAQTILQEAATSSDVGIISAVFNAETIYLDLLEIQGTHLPSLALTFQQRAQNFFHHPNDFSYYHLFRGDFLTLKNKIAEALLRFDFTLANDSPVTAEQIKSLLPFLGFLNEVSELIENVDYWKIHKKYKSEKFDYESAIYSIRAKFENINEGVNLLREITIKLQHAYADKVELFQQIEKLGLEVSIKKVEQKGQVFENAFYNGFKRAIHDYQLTPLEQLEVLNAFSQISLDLPKEGTPHVLSSKNTNYSSLSIDDLRQRVGFRFLQTILMNGYNFQATAVKADLNYFLMKDMVRLNRAVQIHIESTSDQTVSRPATRWAREVEAETGPKANTVKERAKAIYEMLKRHK